MSYRCASGECRRTSNQCPVMITCPDALPVKCPDSQCVVAKYHCTPTIEQTCDHTEFTCPNGDCAKSKILCSAIRTCLRDEVKCWDGSCTDDLINCPEIDS